MQHVDWSPKGSDGASTEEESATMKGDDGPTDAQIDDAVGVFVTVAGAVVNEEMELARVTWEGFCYRIARLLDPYAMFVQAGIFATATAVRAASGDPEPTGPPSGEMSLTMLATDRETGEIQDMEEIDIAASVIAWACNWEWQKIGELLSTKVDQLDDDSEFLQTLGAVLMSVFIGVGGLESTSRGS